MSEKVLDRIRDALVRRSQIGKLKVDAIFLRRERDRLVQRLGETALALLQEGQLQEHAGLSEVLAELRRLERKLDDVSGQMSEIQRELGPAAVIV